jgi:hypothetical protein
MHNEVCVFYTARVELKRMSERGNWVDFHNPVFI